ncbi:hypothetical protein OG871_40350 (plasmid) [Kitasatospora sp. NBC_00374]|uniref:hypothetical protein n=1 Tax=Kitasatospora sp. NBC_00374 TaxID=2975964 RepID=UPI002F9167B2
MPVSERLRRKFHRSARFRPARRDEPGTLPAVTVAGVMVFTYVDELGQLRVSVDLDTTHRALVERPAGRGTVPLRVDVQDDTVYYEPSERAGVEAWAVSSESGGLELFADDSQRAEREAERLRGVLLSRLPGEREWLTVHNFGQDHRLNAALGLIAALVEEARNWACDDTGDLAVLERLDSAEPGEQLEILAGVTLVPDHLADAVTEAVRVLAPKLLG